MRTKGRELGFVLCLGELAFHGLPVSAQAPSKPSNSEQVRVLSTREQAETVLTLIRDLNPESSSEKISSRVPKIKEGLEALDKSDREIAELVANSLALIDRNEAFKGITLAEGVVAAKQESSEGKLEIQKGMLVLLASDGKQIAEFGRFYGPVNCWALHSSNRWLAIGCGNTSLPKDRGGGYTKVGFIDICDLKTKQKVEHIHGANHFGPVTQIGFDGDRLFYVAGDYEQSGGK